MTEFYAVQCYQCSTFQCQQKRADRSMRCRICGAKQSIRKIFASSTKAKDVRKAVQALNLARGSAEEEFERKQCEEGDDHVEEEAQGDERSNDMFAGNQVSGDSFCGKILSTDNKREESFVTRKEDFEEDGKLYTTIMPGEMTRGKKRKEKRIGGVNKQNKERRKGCVSQWTSWKIKSQAQSDLNVQVQNSSGDRGKLADASVQDDVAFTMGDPGAAVEEETIL